MLLICKIGCFYLIRIMLENRKFLVPGSKNQNEILSPTFIPYFPV